MQENSEGKPSCSLSIKLSGIIVVIIFPTVIAHKYPSNFALKTSFPNFHLLGKIPSGSPATMKTFAERPSHQMALPRLLVVVDEESTVNIPYRATERLRATSFCLPDHCNYEFAFVATHATLNFPGFSSLPELKRITLALTRSGNKSRRPIRFNVSVTSQTLLCPFRAWPNSYTREKRALLPPNCY